MITFPCNNNNNISRNSRSNDDDSDTTKELEESSYWNDMICSFVANGFKRDNTKSSPNKSP